MRSGSKWPMIGPRPCAYAYAYVVFSSQSCDIIKSTNTRRANLSIFLVLMLMSTQFSLAYTCACAYALVKTRLFFFLKRNGLSIYKLPPADCRQAFFYCKVMRLLKNEKEFHPPPHDDTDKKIFGAWLMRWRQRNLPHVQSLSCLHEIIFHVF